MHPTWKWSTLPWQAAVALVIFVFTAVLMLPQIAVLALTNPSTFAGDDKLTLPQLLALWVQADPTTISRADVPGVVHWLLIFLVMGGGAVCIVLFFTVRHRQKKDPQRKPGLAPLKDVNRELSTKQLVSVRGPLLRPTISPRDLRPTDCGYRVGEFWGIDLWLRMEDPTIIIGPSRSGKGWFLILNWIMSAPGALITTSSKLDNAALTLLARERLGSKCWIFAPGIDGGDNFGRVLRWDPVEGCVDERTLVRRIRALIPSDSFSGSTSNGGHWDTLGQQLAAHLFHAAACAGADVDTIWDWVSSPQRAFDAVQAIRNHPEGLAEHARHLETVINMPPEQRATQWGVLPTVLAFLESRAARAWMKPAPGEQFDPVSFVLQKQTIYMVGDKQSAGGYTRIIDGLFAELDYVTKGIADASPGNRVDPPVSYILDELGNFEYQGLYEIITAGGGRGRVVVGVFQSKEQLAQWGQENAKTMWDAAVAKIVLPGGSDEEELRKLSGLIGELWVRRESHSWGGGPASIQVSEEKRAVLEASEIREMMGGYGLLFYRNLKPVIAKLTPFDQNPAYERCRKDQAEMAKLMREASPFAAKLAEHARLSDA
ncbi:TraM recognition domain-containing protein [Leucobacter chromiireducens]|uniref:Type IV secretory system conjugative DNA transfer family protein n=1 Tax=Leucobacter chromiireducens subsp. solipictus TaxID=398235 RepID=A0ABS1SDY6_9MICO|nr:TraM recognition domain-containing protein [Leucobacter chromiireducens]MBL3678547.1 type IV secretory system conjugative DNA transfer family protein [Leucobacter chromiireducens subsp. solipictus]